MKDVAAELLLPSFEPLANRVDRSFAKISQFPFFIYLILPLTPQWSLGVTIFFKLTFFFLQINVII